MSKWNRDLGTLKSADVASAMAKTIPVRPTDAELDAAPLEPVKHRTTGEYLPGHWRDLEARREAADSVDEDTKKAAIAAASAAVDAFGGEAHVHLAGAVRFDGDESSSMKGSKVVTVRVTVTKYLPIA